MCTTILDLGLVATDFPSCFVCDGDVYRNGCPVKASEVERCRWLCTSSLFVNRPHVCELSELGRSDEVVVCRDCLLGSELEVASTSLSSVVRLAATKNSSIQTRSMSVNLPPAPTTVPSTVDKVTVHTTAATCTSLKPYGTDPPAVKALENGISFSYRFACGRSAATVTECPCLCSRGPSNHTLRLCDMKGVSDPTMDPIDSRLVCENCSLPRNIPIPSLVSSSSVVPSTTCTSTSSTGTLCPLVKHHTTSAIVPIALRNHCS